MPDRPILVATTNPGKIAELKMLFDQGIQWLSLADIPALPEVEEDGMTFSENARKKASEYARLSGLWTLSDDSGLVVDALDGAPGVFSARFAGMTGDRQRVDRANSEKLLAQLQGLPQEHRGARFVCCLCLADPQQVLAETTGTLEGIIHESHVGTNGFGYDPIFYVTELEKTAAQLSAEQKNAISHRGKALRAMKPALEKLLSASLQRDPGEIR
jgi:XTP/dITP diphosphohydrolase